MPEEQVVEEQVVEEQLDDAGAEPELDAMSDGEQLDQIGRLVGKVKGLITLTEQNRAELAQTNDELSRAHEDNEQLRLENEELRAQLTTAESTSAELSTVLAERAQVRSRVQDLLEQLEAIDI